MANLLDNENFPTQIYMPITTVQQMYYNNEALDSILVALDKEVDYKEVREQNSKGFGDEQR